MLAAGPRSLPRVPLAAVAFAFAAALGGCRVGGAVEPVPLLGPAPRTILVWPHVDAEFVDRQPLLLTGLDDAVRRRGYDVVTSAVAERLLADAEAAADGADRAEAIRAATGADALLRLAVHEFRGDAGATSVDWDLAWELVSLETGEIVWRFAHRSRWDRRQAAPQQPFTADDMEPPVVLFGDRAADFRNAAHLVAWLHRFALEHLPARER